jgi:hypothetical protein
MLLLVWCAFVDCLIRVKKPSSVCQYMIEMNGNLLRMPEEGHAKIV